MSETIFITKKQLDFLNNFVKETSVKLEKEKEDLENGTQTKIIKIKNNYCYYDIQTGEELNPNEYKLRYYKFINKI